MRKMTQRTNRKRVDLNLNVSLIILNVNGLNMEVIKLMLTIICYL